MDQKTSKSFKVGDRIKYKANGKVSRLEGMAGKMVTATVEEVRGDELSVMPDYRKCEGAIFEGMGASVLVADAELDI